MMQRIPEPELMDEPEQARAYSEADFSEPHQAFVSHFRARFPRFDSGSVLDLGCGPADVTLRFARGYPGAVVTGVDGAQAMLELGRKRLAEAGLEDRVSLIHACLPTAISHRYDALISNSLLHHLTDPMVLWDAIAQAALPGAPVFIMDLLRPDSIAEAERLTAIHACDAPAVLRKDFYNSLLAAFSLDEIHAQLKASSLDRFQVEQVSDRHIVIWGHF